jgi:hypothetical protein
MALPALPHLDPLLNGWFPRCLVTLPFVLLFGWCGLSRSSDPDLNVRWWRTLIVVNPEPALLLFCG